MSKLLYSLGITLLFSTFVFAQDTKKVEVEVILKTTTSWTGAVLPSYPKGQPEITILKVIIPPKTKLPVHEHPVINAGILTKGVLTVITKDKKVLQMKAGDSISEVVKTWHHGENQGDEAAEIIVFYAGIKGAPITIKEK